MQLIKGAPAIADIKEEIAAIVAEKKPCLVIVRVGNKPDDIYYQKSVEKKCEQCGIELRLEEFDENISFADFAQAFGAINADPSVHGILMLRPLPKQLNEDDIRGIIAPEKDIDCMSPLSLAKIFEGDDSGFAPCTAEAVVHLLEHEGIDVKGKEIVIIGRSTVVGKPLAMMLLSRHATITMCHTRTVDLPAVCRRADILVAAAGKARMVDGSFVKPGAIVMDVGINMDENGNMCGDVDSESVEKVASMMTPVPGGVGGVTSWLLLQHVALAAKNAHVVVD